jgi:stage IV sporulation protein B
MDHIDRNSGTKKKRWTQFFLLAVLFLMFMGLFVGLLVNSFLSPLRITMLKNQSLFLPSGKYLKVNVKLSSEEEMRVLKQEDQIRIHPVNPGTAEGKITLFDVLHLKRFKVHVVEEQKVLAMGNAVGVRLHLEGALIEAVSPVMGVDGKKYYPAKQAGLKRGDLILEADEESIFNIKDLTQRIERGKGKDILVKYLRDGQESISSVSPVKLEDGSYKIGVWVKDSIYGIGTITFCTPNPDYAYGGLGHGISNQKQDDVLPIRGGEVFYTEIDSVKKGISGNPGELKGNLMLEYQVLGKIEKNTPYGIFGKLDRDFISSNPSHAYFIGYEQHVNKGEAYILSNIEGNEVKKYSIQIQKITNKPFKSPKGMIVHITDPSLLKKTGGIVQGMSGSPIIQNGRLIGAITHVLVNEPSKGYGILIEDMLQQSIG